MQIIVTDPISDHRVVIDSDDLADTVTPWLGSLSPVARNVLADVVHACDTADWARANQRAVTLGFAIELTPACTGAADLCGAGVGEACEPGCPSLATDEMSS